MKTNEHLPPLVKIPERLKKYLPQKMGFQLNGYETVLQVAPTEKGVHCEHCCSDLRGEYFLMENCDLWVVTQTGDIFVLPFGDDEFQYKFTAKNYIPWRPYTYSSFSCFARTKESFPKPFWKDYIGFQTDEFECVIFWRRTLIYHGAYDGRGIPSIYNYHVKDGNATINKYEHKSFELDIDGKIIWEKDTSNHWQPKLRERPDIYFYTQQTTQRCDNIPPDICTCGYTSGANTMKSNLSRWNTWMCGSSTLSSGGSCSPCSNSNRPFDMDGKPSPEPPECDNEEVATLTCREKQCAVLDAELCGFQITGCPDGNTARFMVRNNQMNVGKYYRFLGIVDSKEEIPGYWEPQNNDHLPPSDITQELADVEIYNAPKQGLQDFDVYGVVPDNWDTLEESEKEFPERYAEWYYLFHERWIKGTGTVHELKEANAHQHWGFLFQDEKTNTVPCNEDTVPVVPFSGSSICCGDWWAANFGGSSADRIVGYQGQLLFKKSGTAYKGTNPITGERELMEEEMVCCDNWIFARMSVADETQLNILYAITRDEHGNFALAENSWQAQTSYADAWHFHNENNYCCPTQSKDSPDYGGYLRLENLWSTKVRALFYNGTFLKVYDWRGYPGDGAPGCSGHSSVYYPGRIGHAERCPAGTLELSETLWDVWQGGTILTVKDGEDEFGEDIMIELSCVPVCNILTFPEVEGYENPSTDEPWAVELLGVDFRVSEVWNSLPAPPPEVLEILPNATCTASLTSVRWQAVNRCVLIETGQLFANKITAGEVVLRTTSDGTTRLYKGRTRTSQGGWIYQAYENVSGTALSGSEATFALNPANWFSTFKKHNSNSIMASGWSEICVSNLIGQSPYSTTPSNVFPESIDDGIYWMFLNVPNTFMSDYAVGEVKASPAIVHYSSSGAFTLSLAAYRPYRKCRPGCFEREIPLSERWHALGGMTVPLVGAVNSSYASLGMCGAPPSVSLPTMRTGICDSVDNNNVTQRRYFPFFDRATLPFATPSGGNCNIAPSGKIHSFFLRDTILAIGETSSFCTGNYSIFARHLVSENVTCQMKRIPEFDVDGAYGTDYPNIDPVNSTTNTMWRTGLGSPCGNSNCHCIPVESTCNYPVDSLGNPVTPNTPPENLENGPQGIGSVKVECFGWYIYQDENTTPTHPDELFIEYDVVSKHSGTMVSRDCYAATVLPFYDCNTSTGIGSCRSNEINVSSSATNVGTQIIVFDHRTGHIHSLYFTKEPGASYYVSCCGAYWWLAKTKDGVTVMTLYYVDRLVTTWTNSPTVSYHFECCASAGKLFRTENDESELYKVFVCDQDVTNSIVNKDDNLRLECCGDYAVIMTGDWKLDWAVYENEEEPYALLSDGTRLVPASYYDEKITEWKTDDEHAWRIANPPKDDPQNPDMINYATSRLDFKEKITDTRWAALYHCGTQLVVDKRLESIRCLQCGDDSFVLCPIMDEIDVQRWGIQKSYFYNTGGGGPLDVSCENRGEMWFGKWTHNPHQFRNRRPPTLMKEDADDLARWLESFPNMGIYIALNGALVSINPGAESNGGLDIQEQMPPDDTPDGEEFTAPDDTPSGDYLYINDRNAAVRYDKQIEKSDQAWNHNCGTIPIKFSAQSLDDLPAAPAVQCRGKRPVYGIEGTNRGRVVISGNGVLSVYDSELGRMDFSLTNGCKLR
jgi:hypothetical protein